MDKRIYQLSDAVSLTDRYMVVDKTGSTEAERYLVLDFVNLLMSQTYRMKTVAVTAGANTIHFSSNLPSADYELITKLVLDDGSLSGGDESNKLAGSFDYYAYDDGNLTYFAGMEI